MLPLKNKGNVRGLMAMMWCNYLQGDLFERFYSNNLLTPSYILWGIQFNCTPCALTQWNSTRCGWWMRQRLHPSKIICILAALPGLLSIPLRIFSWQLWGSSLCLSSCFRFSQDQNCTLLSSAWPPVAMATQGRREAWRVGGRARRRLNQKEYLFTSQRCINLIADFTLRCRLC